MSQQQVNTIKSRICVQYHFSSSSSCTIGSLCKCFNNAI